MTASCPTNAKTATSGNAVTGTVYYDKNQNGRQDPGEPGLAGIPVYLSSGPDSMTPGVEKSISTCTGKDGRFTLLPKDKYNGFRVFIRTGWFRTQCPGLTCAPGGPGDNVAAGPEWIYSEVLTGRAGHHVNAGLIPDAGQYVVDIHSKHYSTYPPTLAKAHPVDLAARFTDDETSNCRTTTNGVSCHIGQLMGQTLYIANSGLTPVSGIKAVMQLPWGERHKSLQLLRTGSSPGITGVTDIKVVPAKGPRKQGTAATADNYTTMTFTIEGTVPPAGLIAVLSLDELASGTPGTQIVGHAGITAEANASSDHDSAFCTAPALPQSCGHIQNTHSFLDLSGDDNDSDRFNVLAP
ncbi:hypothetical protein [Amnibacterium sp.]|uniref:hypothetical protein n=1 Tax=Amnibacterium sp. TaxID=1872496 RepID=UPI003F7C5749